MNITNILKQKKITQDLEERIKQSIEATTTYLRAVNPDDAAIEAFEKATQQAKQEQRKNITFKYPTRTVQEADIDHHRKIHEQEIAYKQELQQWNDARRAEANQRIAPPGEGEVQENRQEQQAPIYIKPTSNVIKIGDAYTELKLQREFNRDTMAYEWVRQDTEILERPENNDIVMEDNSIAYENKEKTKVDWETTLQNLKHNGEKLGYSKTHFLKCLLRIMNQNEDDLYLTYKDETCPEKIANSLLARYIGMNKKKLFENKLKALTRTKGQPLREVMCQADVLADRILYKCKDPQEKAYRKYQIMLDALKSFSSEDMGKELMQALRGSAISGERPNIEDLIDTVEVAEKVNENSKPDRDKTFMNDKTSERCEIFTLGTQEASKYNNRPRSEETSRSLERAIEQTKEMSIRGREERRKSDQTKEYGLFKNREKSYDRDNQSKERKHQNERQSRINGPRERLRTSERYPSRDRRETSQTRTFHRERNYSNEGRGRNSEESRNRTYERDNRQDYRRQNENYNRRDRSRDTQNRQDYRSYERGNRDTYGSRSEGDRSNTWYRNGSEQRDREENKDNSRQSERQRYRENSRTRENTRFRDNSRSGDRFRPETRVRDNSRSGEYQRSRDKSWSRDNPRYREYSRSRDNQRTRDSSNNYRERTGDNTRQNKSFRSQSRERNSWRTVPQHKRNLEGVEFPPKTLMDLTVRFCVKCHNTLEEHYPWDCKLYRYWSNSPCDICYNGQHKSKECRKNPNRVDAFTVMLENTQPQKNDQMKTNYNPF